MAAEQVLKLLDSYWFETTILTNKIPLKFHQTVNPIISHNKVVEEVLPLDTNNLLEVPTLEVRSYSDQNLGSSTPNTILLSDSPSSPNSVLTMQKLRSIPSGTELSEVREFLVSNRNHEKEDINNNSKKKLTQSYRRKRRGLRRKGKATMSLSELEFKELKGFMDLGFVFSEEDVDSRLVSLIPGLQRLGRKKDAREGDDDDDEVEEEHHNIDESVISDNKPYLSEAWGVLDQRGVRNPLLNWRVPVKGNEVDMKHNLRFWAHTVASIVR